MFGSRFSTWWIRLPFAMLFIVAWALYRSESISRGVFGIALIGLLLAFLAAHGWYLWRKHK